MCKWRAEFMPETINRKGFIAGHKQQEKPGANHKQVKSAVKIALHGGEVDEDNPENIITDDRELVAITNDYTTGNNRPDA